MEDKLPVLIILDVQGQRANDNFGEALSVLECVLFDVLFGYGEDKVVEVIIQL